MLTIQGIDDLRARVGQELGVSDWVLMDQDAINEFAAATGDHQFIHVDPEKAAQTPFGSTIAHGLFTLSLGPRFIYEIFTIEGAAFVVNYGYEKIRFPGPVKVGANVRMRATLAEVTDVNGGVQARITQTFEVEGVEKPVCVAESLTRIFAGA